MGPLKLAKPRLGGANQTCQTQGLVPISPNTTPSAATTPTRLTVLTTVVGMAYPIVAEVGGVVLGSVAAFSVLIDSVRGPTTGHETVSSDTADLTSLHTQARGG